MTWLQPNANGQVMSVQQMQNGLEWIESVRCSDCVHLVTITQGARNMHWVWTVVQLCARADGPPAYTSKYFMKKKLQCTQMVLGIMEIGQAGVSLPESREGPNTLFAVDSLPLMLQKWHSKLWQSFKYVGKWAQKYLNITYPKSTYIALKNGEK